MSSTRHTETPGQYRQERFCSSAEFELGLMGNLVAKRCSVLDARPDRELIWFLQLLSHAPGGLGKLVADLIAKYPQRVATVAMQRFGIDPGQVYTPDQVREVRKEIPKKTGVDRESHFPLRGEYSELPIRDRLMFYDDDGGRERMESDQRERSNAFPVGYPAQTFVDLCHRAAAQLEQLLADHCLDPARMPANCAPWYFPTLINTLREFQADWIAAKRSGQVVTELGRQVFGALDYCLEERCLVVIDGQARTGKTFSTKAWCDARPGLVRYVQVPSFNDDIGFFKAIARSLGVSVNQNSKAQQLRDRVEEVLQRGNLAVVFDEAHYLWPQTSNRMAVPARINWIMTALVNHGVPVALVTTPQFLRSQKVLERNTSWTSEQFLGRVGHYHKLPDTISAEDMAAVARVMLPDSCARSIETLVLYAQASSSYLASIEHTVRRARKVAREAGRDTVQFADVKHAIQGSVIPSRSALAESLAEPPKRGHAHAIAPAAPALPAPQRPGRATQPAAPAPEEFAARQSLGTERSEAATAAV